MAKALVKYETIGELQIKDIMDGREPQPPEDWDDTIEPDRPDDGSLGVRVRCHRHDRRPGRASTSRVRRNGAGSLFRHEPRLQKEELCCAWVLRPFRLPRSWAYST